MGHSSQLMNHDFGNECRHRSLRQDEAVADLDFLSLDAFG